MKVLLTSHAYVVRENLKKAELLAQMGVELTVLAPKRWRHEFGAFEAPHDVSGFRFITLDTAGTGDNDNFCYKEALPEEEFDIAHIEQEPWSFVTHHLILHLRAKKKIVFTWENIYRRRFLLGDMENAVLRHAAAIVAGNDGAREVVEAKGFRGPVFILPQFGVDTKLFKRVPAERTSKDFVVGYAGRLVEAKGIFELLRAAALLDAELVMIGSGNEEKALVKLARKLRYEKLRLLGARPRGEMPLHYSGMDVFVLASKTTRKWKEQFGMALAEAMACGVAVVGSNSGAIPYVVGDAGLIVPEGDAAALADALLRLKMDKTLRDQLAQKARTRVLDHFSAEIVARRTLEIYERVSRL